MFGVFGIVWVFEGVVGWVWLCERVREICSYFWGRMDLEISVEKMP